MVDPNGDIYPPERIEAVRLYLDDNVFNNNIEQGAFPARVWIDPEPPREERVPQPPATGQFHLLIEQQDYTLTNDINFAFPRIQLNNQLPYNHILAIAYIQSTGGLVDTVGTWWPDNYVPAPPDSLDLKMLRPSEEQWGLYVWAPVRYLEAKNVYSLQAQDIDPWSLTLNVVRDIAGAGGQNPDYIENEFGKRTPLLQVLGLDQKNNFDPSNRTPDTRIDPEFVDLADGLLFFPDLRPFDPDLADIEGTAIRTPSWPRQFGKERPDTLGWYKSGDLAVPSSPARRNLEVIPEIYDLHYRALSAAWPEHHLYTIEFSISDDLPQH